jgi:hypothetical protein
MHAAAILNWGPPKLASRVVCQEMKFEEGLLSESMLRSAVQCVTWPS